MKSRRFLLALLVAGASLSGSLHAIAAPAHSSNGVAYKDKDDSPPRPKPTPGPRDGGSD